MSTTNPAVVQEPFVYTENKKTIALDQRVALFLENAKRDFDQLPGCHYMRIEGLVRNLVISRMYYYLLADDGLPELRGKIREFFGDDKWIVGVANYHIPTGITFDLIGPSRHHDVGIKVRSHFGSNKNRDADMDQGFLCYQQGNAIYLGREESMVVAENNGQLRRVSGDKFYQGDELYSEDLW